MTLYFFHVDEAAHIHDDHGVELVDDAAARRQGVMILGDILRSEPQAFWSADQCRVTATRADGAVLFSLGATAERA